LIFSGGYFMEEIEFTRNYSDHCTDQGFQFEFNCNRCGNGYRSSFQPWVVGAVSGALDAASSLCGGVFGQAANMGERVRSATWQQARDKAFIDAAQKLKPNFVQCPRCSSWVCRKSCWNPTRGLCKQCAPDLTVEISAQQSAKAIEKIRTDVNADAEDEAVISNVGNAKVRASCPQCNAALMPNAKFCPECGAKLQEKKFCAECGSTIIPGAKFCPECGAKNSP
jgi:membrane protease subunit (stomatin/prohibitin family)